MFDMPYIAGTYILKNQSATSRMNSLIDDKLTPRLLTFRHIEINDEPASLMQDGVTWRTTFGNWLEGYPMVFRKNGGVLRQQTSVVIIDASLGQFNAGPVDLGADNMPRDTMEVTYEMDYFPNAVLEGLLVNAVDVVNTAAVGSSTQYTVDTMPKHWDGVVVDMAFAMAMERLLLDYDLWKYRLVFAIGPDSVYGGGSSDVVSQMERLKQNAEERANKTLDNPKFKCGNYLAAPTTTYYDAVRGIGGGSGAHGVPFLSGRLRGWKPNSYL